VFKILPPIESNKSSTPDHNIAGARELISECYLYMTCFHKRATLNMSAGTQALYTKKGFHYPLLVFYTEPYHTRGRSEIHTYLYTLFAVRNEPKPVLRYPSIRIRLSIYLYESYGHFKMNLFQKDKRILENNGLFLAANRV